MNGSDATISPTARDATASSPPELIQAELDAATLEQLFADLAACAQMLEITPKLEANQMVPATGLTLAEARALLASRSIRGLQIRYLHEEAEWWDTLLLTPTAIRLVRIRHA